MDKFNEELKKAKNPWIQRIGNYLLSRDDIRENLKKENKSLKECFDYILIQLSENAVRDGNVGYAAGDDEELYTMAVHYYDEDDIKVGTKNFKTNADGSANPKNLISKDYKKSDKKEENVQKKIDKAVKAALDKYKEEEKEKEQRKKEAKKAKSKTKKSAKNVNDDQLNIFEIMGDDSV